MCAVDTKYIKYNIMFECTDFRKQFNYKSHLLIHKNNITPFNKPVIQLNFDICNVKFKCYKEKERHLDTMKHKENYNSIFNNKDENIKQQNSIKLMEEWDKRPNLKILREWWDLIPTSFEITSVGNVLAHSNAQRCDKNLPPLD